MAGSSSLIFPDELDKYREDPSLAFFELANATEVIYRLPQNNDDDEDAKEANETTKKSESTNTTTAILPPRLIRICQDSQAQTHTGGVVWETAYLLLGYLLLQKQRQSSLGRLVEVGAGCGLLGIALAVANRATDVTLTEVDQVLPLLKNNLECNQTLLKTCPCRAVALDWTNYRDQAQAASLQAHSVDTIVGTDVVFSPSLVEPLWQTLDYLAHERTVIYICVQIRCAVSHQLLLDQASNYRFLVQDITHDTEKDDEDDGEERAILPRWAQDLECFLFRIQRVEETSLDRGARKRAHKRQKKHHG